MLKNPVVKNVLSVLAIAVFGFVLLNLTFMLDYAFQSLIDAVIRLFVSSDINMEWRWFPPLKHGMFVVIILVISWLVFRSKLGTLYKAIYMVVPLAVIFVTMGMFLYNVPVVPYVAGAAFTFGVFVVCAVPDKAAVAVLLRSGFDSVNDDGGGDNEGGDVRALPKVLPFPLQVGTRCQDAGSDIFILYLYTVRDHPSREAGGFGGRQVFCGEQMDIDIVADLILYVGD